MTSIFWAVAALNVGLSMAFALYVRKNADGFVTPAENSLSRCQAADCWFSAATIWLLAACLALTACHSARSWSTSRDCFLRRTTQM